MRGPTGVDLRTFAIYLYFNDLELHLNHSNVLDFADNIVEVADSEQKTPLIRIFCTKKLHLLQKTFSISHLDIIYVYTKDTV